MYMCSSYFFVLASNGALYAQSILYLCNFYKKAELNLQSWRFESSSPHSSNKPNSQSVVIHSRRMFKVQELKCTKRDMQHGNKFG